MQNHRVSAKPFFSRAIVPGIIWIIFCLSAFFSSCGRNRYDIQYQNGTKIVISKLTDFTATLEKLEMIDTFPGEAVEDTTFGKIVWLDFDTHGNIYAMDFFDQIIYKISPQWTITERIGHKGKGPGELLNCNYFLWKDGMLLCANKGNSRIEIFSDEGDYIKSVKLRECQRPTSIWFQENSYFVAQKKTSTNMYRIIQYDTSFRFVSGLYADQSIDEPLDILRRWSAVTYGREGFWLVYYQVNLLRFVTWKGEEKIRAIPEMDWLLKDEEGEIFPEYPVHRHGDVDPEGSLYVVTIKPPNFADRSIVYKYAPDGRLLGQAFQLPTKETKVIRFGPDGKFYFSDGIRIFRGKILKR